MVRFLKKGLLLGLAALFLCCAIGCKSSQENKAKAEESPKTWGEDTRQNILEGAENR